MFRAVIASIVFLFCSSLQSEEVVIRQNPGGSLDVLMSFSVPEQIWVEISSQLVRVGGRFLVRGLPNENMGQFIARVKWLQERGVKAQIDLDPERFEERFSNAVPCYVLSVGEKSDWMEGAVTVAYFLKSVEQRGECSDAAQRLLSHL